ncbi:AAA family ATPase [Vibrio harveyi]|uniref:AAA family ATPase n=1 Tax=Vibrio TaxID=662 RepID=UPI001EF3485B|nr:AAA family ATPase [Vibrio sp. MMH1-50]MCG7517916.1 AAA family ATPase [Vibrio sp. MMH1-50]
MKIKSLTVKKLFGIFDHEIIFKDNITILIGENGLGKTVILEMLNNIFKRRFHEVASVSFDKFNITFENNTSWSFRVQKNQLQVRDLTKSSNPWKNLTSTHSKFHAYKNKVKNLDHYYPKGFEKHFRRVNIQTEDFYEDIFFHEVWEREMKKSKSNPIWFDNIIDKIEINLIETQRILTSYDDNEKYRSTISDCAENLKDRLKIYASESQKITAELDSSFPNRIITTIDSNVPLSYEEINKELYEINEKRKELTNLGLLTKLNIEEIINLKRNDDSILRFINLYIQDSKKKLAPYSEIFDKLSLFINIANSRLKHKKILSCLDNGFKIQSTVLFDEEGNPIEFPFNKLSSGEQHEIILFYKLIFLYKDQSLVLLDEPELSLHISWQNNFINDIKNIINENGLTVLIATHSPDIIGEHWSLTQELIGVEV